MKRKPGEKRIWTKAAAAAVWLALWQILAAAFGRYFILPSPVLTFRTLCALAAQPMFWHSCAATLSRVSLGLLSACALGLVCAFGSAKDGRIKELLAVPSATVKSVPVMSVILFALLLLRSAAVPVFVSFLMCFPVMYENTLAGFESVPREYRELAKVYGIGGRRYFSGIMLPSATGYIKAGLGMCAGLGWKSAVVAEVLSSPRTSMGYHLLSAKMYLDGPSLFAWTAAIVLMSMGFERLIKSALRRF